MLDNFRPESLEPLMEFNDQWESYSKEGDGSQNRELVTRIDEEASEQLKDSFEVEGNPP